MTTSINTINLFADNAAVLSAFDSIEQSAAQRDEQIRVALCSAVVLMHSSGNVTLCDQIMAKVPAKRKTERTRIARFFKTWAPVKFKDDAWTYNKDKRFANFTGEEKYTEMLAADWTEDAETKPSTPKAYSLAETLSRGMKAINDASKGYELPADIKAELEAVVSKVIAFEKAKADAAKAKATSANVQPQADNVDAGEAIANLSE